MRRGLNIELKVKSKKAKKTEPDKLNENAIFIKCTNPYKLINGL